MKALVTPKGTFGPFTSVTTLADRYRADNNDYPFTVVGTGTIVEADTVTFPTLPVSAQDRAALLLRIDADVDALYRAVQGDRGAEYALAEADATAYKAAGYTGTVPSSVQSWATAKGWTATQAANDILTTATAWRGAQALIRANRLGLKESARTATDIATVASQWSAFLSQAKSMLGVA